MTNLKILGAPWMNETWTLEMRTLNIPLSDYRFQCFTPTTSKFEGNVSCGLQVYTRLNSKCSYEIFDPVHVGVSLLWKARQLYATNDVSGEGDITGSFHWKLWNNNGVTDIYDIDVLAGGPMIREGIEAGLTPDQIRHLWQDDLNQFKAKRERYLLY